MAHILAVDDEMEVLGTVKAILEKDGHNVTPASNGAEALELLNRIHPDLVILDIIMPEMTGVEICRRIRANPYTVRVPVLFLTAKGRTQDVAFGLDAGGDDYLVKPFEVIELPARVRALLRRAPGRELDPEGDSIVVGDLHIRSTQPQVTIGQRVIDLTDIEHRLLHYMGLHPGQPLSPDHLLQHIWGYPPGVGNPNAVHVTIKRLREKIEDDPSSPHYIRNVRSQGYLIG